MCLPSAGNLGETALLKPVAPASPPPASPPPRAARRPASGGQAAPKQVVQGEDTPKPAGKPVQQGGTADKTNGRGPRKLQPSRFDVQPAEKAGAAQKVPRRVKVHDGANPASASSSGATIRLGAAQGADAFQRTQSCPEPEARGASAEDSAASSSAGTPGTAEPKKKSVARVVLRRKALPRQSVWSRLAQPKTRQANDPASPEPRVSPLHRKLNLPRKHDGDASVEYGGPGQADSEVDDAFKRTESDPTHSTELRTPRPTLRMKLKMAMKFSLHAARFRSAIASMQV